MQTGDLGSLRAGVFPGDEIQHLATIDALGHFVYASATAVAWHSGQSDKRDERTLEQELAVRRVNLPLILAPKKSLGLRFVFTPVDLFPQPARYQAVNPVEHQSSLSSSNPTASFSAVVFPVRIKECRDHVGVERHPDLCVKPVAGHDAICHVQPDPVHDHLQHGRIGLADVPTFISHLAPAHASMAPTMAAASSGQR